MTCRELTELVTEYLDARLSLWQRASFQLHLGLCLSCRRYIRQMRGTIRVLGRVPADPLTPDARLLLLERFRSWRR